jgi:multiple sugar transport system ATP-binding protein
VRKPSIFLFDEPLSNLDAALRVQMRIEITRLHQSLKNTMIYVTHDQVEAMTMGQRIAIFNAGKIEQVGVPMDLYLRPANEFVAGFLGTPKINFMTATANAASRELTLLNNHVLTGLPADWDWEAAAQVARIGVRPEHWHLGQAGVGLQAQLELSEHLGDAVLLHIRLEGMDDLLTLKLSKLPYPISPGAKIWIQPELEHIILFNEQAQRISVTAE